MKKFQTLMYCVAFSTAYLCSCGNPEPAQQNEVKGLTAGEIFDGLMCFAARDIKVDSSGETVYLTKSKKPNQFRVILSTKGLPDDKIVLAEDLNCTFKNEQITVLGYAGAEFKVTNIVAADCKDASNQGHFKLTRLTQESASASSPLAFDLSIDGSIAEVGKNAQTKGYNISGKKLTFEKSYTIKYSGSALVRGCENFGHPGD